MNNKLYLVIPCYNEEEVLPETAKRLKDKDKHRAAYYQFYTEMKWGAVENYHVTLNSGVLGIEKCVDILAGLY